MRTVSFRDGGMAWPLFRRMINGEISPAAAVAATRREPAGAYDQAMRRGARDQNGGLTREYFEATMKYLAAAGLPSAAPQESAALPGRDARRAHGHCALPSGASIALTAPPRK
jgi:hypothetical protein